MKKVTIQFHNKEIKSFKVRGKKSIKSMACKQLNFCLLNRYKHIEQAQWLLQNNAYLQKDAYACVKIHNIFYAFILGEQEIDGRTKEAKKLPYFSIEEYLANF